MDRRPGDAITSNLPVPAADENDVHGRLFFRQGRYYGSCSATVVNTRRLNLAVTAGHCLWLGKWSRHVVFVPAYSHGHRPYGSFVAKHAWIIRAWHRFPDINYDIGAVILRPNRFGRVGNVVGASGWGWNHSRRRQFNIFGYPAGHFRGEELRQCFSGSRRANWLSRRLPGPPTTGAFCDMAKGSSGGAWMTDDGDGDRYLDGITSYAGTGSRRTLFSPYFGTSAHNLITRAR